MSATPRVTPPSPELFFDVIRRSDETAVLKTALELEVFTAIGEGNGTAAALSNRCQTSERGMRILCDALAIIGFLTKSENTYALTQDSALFLDKRSPAYLGSAAGFLTLPVHREAFDRLTEAVRKGGTAISERGTLEPENPVWVEFARSMAGMMRMPAESIAELLGAKNGKPWKVLDIAAGHGTYGITIARHNPNAQITALDWPNVLEVAKENAQKAGVAGRYHLLPGSAFDIEFGTGYDLVLITGFMHHFDVATGEKLLRKVYASLAPGGQAVILDFVPNEDRVTPPSAAKFSLTMLATTPSGDAYTFAEYERMLRNAGFPSAVLHTLAPQRVVIGVK